MVKPHMQSPVTGSNLLEAQLRLTRVGSTDLYLCVCTEATDSTGFAAVKLTALGRPQLLVQFFKQTVSFIRDIVLLTDHLM